MTKNKKIIKRFLVVLATVFILAAVLFGSTSCAKQPVFGKLVVCEKINPETKEPITEKSEFDFNIKEIFVTLKFENVRGEDNYRFVWKDVANDSILYEISDKYLAGQKGLISTWISSSLTKKPDADILVLPGNYKVEFYHNGELKSSAEFVVNQPKAEILKVQLSKDVNEAAEPISPADKFEPSDVINACVQLDYLVSGDVVKAKFLDSSGRVLLETPYNIKDSYYSPAWINFTFYAVEGEELPVGKYNVEIYLNDKLFGSFPFEIIKEQQIAGEVSFNDGNYFTEAEDKYGFVIGYPDGWSYDLTDNSTGMNVTFNPPSPDAALRTVMFVLNKGSYPTNEKEFEKFITDIAENSRGDMKQKGEPVFNEKKLKNGSTYAEIIYYFTDPNKGEFGLILSTFFYKDRMFLWYGFAHESFYDSLNKAYYSGLDLLELK